MFRGRASIVEALIKAGANVNQKSRSGEKALEWARKQGHAHIEELLLANGAIR
jgi:ankyrin repeat protein